MQFKKRFVLATIALLTAVSGGVSRATDKGEDRRLVPVVKFGEKTSNAVTTSADGRIFVVLQGPAQSPGVEVAECKNGGYEPYPNGDWNGWRMGLDPAKAFVHCNSLRVGPEGDLWVVDTGGLGLGKNILPGGPKVVRIDLKTNTVRKVYLLPESVTKPKSFVDDIRLNGTNAYLTDAGAPGLIVLNIETGKARRVLNNEPSTTGHIQATGEGKKMYLGDGTPVIMHADQLEVTTDGGYFYYQPQAGPFFRIATRYLDDTSLTDAQLTRHVERKFSTPSTGGTAIDAANNLYVTDTDYLCIWKYSLDGKRTLLIRDPRLLWADALWIDAKGYLWIPAAQQNRTPAFQRGVSKVKFPVVVYKMYLGAKPNRH